MSTMALNLQMNYVEVDRDEMEYVDGGFSIQRTWYGTSISLNKGDLTAIADVMTGAAWMGASFSGYCWMISVGAAPATFGMSIPLAGTIAAVAAFSSALVGLGAWTISHLNSTTIPLPGVYI
ncbi:MAG: hypothetical protein AB6733_20655 [Clostridiaceae bacterium]